MKISTDWWTCPTESENGRLIMVTGRRNLENVISSRKYNIRVDVSWKYKGDSSGMPDLKTSILMESVHDAFTETFKKDPVGIMTGVYTGDDERNWIFYTKNLKIFEYRFNEALSTYDDILPLTITAENDSEWNEYHEMKDLAEIMEGE